jgi:hypothetical protein
VNRLLAILGASLGLFLLDRLLLRLEAAGYLYYRKTKPSPGTSASAFNAMQGLLEPGRSHTADVQRDQHVEVDKQPGTPPPGTVPEGLRLAPSGAAPPRPPEK